MCVRWAARERTLLPGSRECHLNQKDAERVVREYLANQIKLLSCDKWPDRVGFYALDKGKLQPGRDVFIFCVIPPNTFDGGKYIAVNAATGELVTW
jgi:hypothetical protein